MQLFIKILLMKNWIIQQNLPTESVYMYSDKSCNTFKQATVWHNTRFVHMYMCKRLLITELVFC